MVCEFIGYDLASTHCIQFVFYCWKVFIRINQNQLNKMREINSCSILSSLSLSLSDVLKRRYFEIHQPVILSFLEPRACTIHSRVNIFNKQTIRKIPISLKIRRNLISCYRSARQGRQNEVHNDVITYHDKSYLNQALLSMNTFVLNWNYQLYNSSP